MSTTGRSQAPVKVTNNPRPNSAQGNNNRRQNNPNNPNLKAPVNQPPQPSDFPKMAPVAEPKIMNTSAAKPSFAAMAAAGINSKNSLPLVSASKPVANENSVTKGTGKIQTDKSVTNSNSSVTVPNSVHQPGMANVDPSQQKPVFGTITEQGVSFNSGLQTIPGTSAAIRPVIPIPVSQIPMVPIVPTVAPVDGGKAVPQIPFPIPSMNPYYVYGRPQYIPADGVNSGISGMYPIPAPVVSGARFPNPIPTGSSGFTLPERAKSSAIKIVNPNTGKQITLPSKAPPAVKKESEIPTKSETLPAEEVQKPKNVEENAEKMNLTSSPVKLPVQTASTPSKTVLKDADGNVLDLKAWLALKKGSKPSESEKPTEAEKTAEAVEPVVKAESVKSESVKSEEGEISGEVDQESENFDESSNEEAEESCHEFTLLDSFDGITYPSGLPKPVLTPRIAYEFAFLKAFRSVIHEKPDALPTKEELYGDAVPMASGRGSGRGGKPLSRQSSGSGALRTSEERYQASLEKRASTSRSKGVSMSKSQSSRGQRRSNMKGKTENEPTEILKMSDKGWLPEFLQKKLRGVKADSSRFEELSKSIVAILNKLTPEKFTSLSNQILEMDLPDSESLNVLIDRIFDKALGEPHYGEMYARLCYKLFIELPKEKTWIVHLVDAQPGRDPVQVNEFRRALLSKCQQEFENGASWAQADHDYRIKLRDPSTSNEEKESLLLEQEARYKLKLRSLGNVRFVGELFKLKMIAPKIMHKCVYDLLNQDEPEEEQTESLCKLMTTIGQALDLPQAKEHMGSYFKQIQALSKNLKLSSRIRFMLLDLIDLRNNNWIPRTKKVGPTTLSQIRQEKPKEAPRMSRQSSGRKHETTIIKKQANRGNDKSENQGWSSSKSNAKRDKSSFDKTNVSNEQENDTEPADPQSTRNMFGLLNDHQEVSEETPALDRNAAIKKIQGIFVEWASIYDTQEVIENLKDLGTKEYNREFVKCFIDKSMDSKADCVSKTSTLLAQLVNEGYVDREQLIDGIATYNEFLDDNAVDIPSVYQFMGLMLGNLVVDSAISLDSLNLAFGILMDSSNSSFKVLCLTLKEIKLKWGAEKLKAAMKEASEFDMKSFVPANKREDVAFIGKTLELYDLKNIFM